MYNPITCLCTQLEEVDETWKQVLQSKDDEIAELKKTIEHKDKEVGSWKEANDKVHTENEKSRLEVNDLSTKLASVVESHKAKESEIKEIEHKNIELLKKIEHLNKEMKQKNE